MWCEEVGGTNLRYVGGMNVMSVETGFRNIILY